MYLSELSKLEVTGLDMVDNVSRKGKRAAVKGHEH